MARSCCQLLVAGERRIESFSVCSRQIFLRKPNHRLQSLINPWDKILIISLCLQGEPKPHRKRSPFLIDWSPRKPVMESRLLFFCEYCFRFDCRESFNKERAQLFKRRLADLRRSSVYGKTFRREGIDTCRFPRRDIPTRCCPGTTSA